MKYVFYGYMEANSSVEITSPINSVLLVTNESHGSGAMSMFIIRNNTSEPTTVITGTNCNITITSNNGKLYLNNTENTKVLVSVIKI